MMFYIGVDGGGTKSRFVLYDEHGRILRQLILPSCHYLQVGPSGMAQIITQGVASLTTDVNGPIAIGLGLAGYGQNQDLVEKINHILDKVLNSYTYIAVSDAKIALIGALHGQPGMLVIAGTGSIVLASSGRQDYRVGGWGPYLGDEGSAYWMAGRLLSIFTQQADGRLEKTQLYELIREGEGLHRDTELITLLGQGSREKIADFARYAYNGAQNGDPYCLKLYEEAGCELARGLNTLCKKMHGTMIPASYAGGMFRAKQYLIEPLKAHLDPCIHFIDPMDPPEYGAYLLIKARMKGEDSDD